MQLYTSMTRLKMALNNGQMPPMKNDLTMTFVQTDDEIAAEFEYHTALLTRQTVMRIGSHFEHILRQTGEDRASLPKTFERERREQNRERREVFGKALPVSVHQQLAPQTDDRNRAEDLPAGENSDANYGPMDVSKQ